MSDHEQKRWAELGVTEANRHADASIRVQEALKLIEAAQTLLGKACEQLSPIEGAAPVYGATHKLYDKVHDLWRRLAYDGGHSARSASTSKRAWKVALYFYEDMFKRTGGVL